MSHKEQFEVLIATGFLVSALFASYLDNADASSRTKLLANIGGQEYELEYTLTGATIVSVEGEPESKTLRILIDAEDDGILTIELPKKLMDSHQDGVDWPFIVSISEGGDSDGGKVVQTAEIFPPRASRIVEIAFTKDTSEIQIVGTYLVPEFGSSSVIFTAIISTILIGALWAMKSSLLGTKTDQRNRQSSRGGSNRQ